MVTCRKVDLNICRRFWLIIHKIQQQISFFVENTDCSSGMVLSAVVSAVTEMLCSLCVLEETAAVISLLKYWITDVLPVHGDKKTELSTMLPWECQSCWNGDSPAGFFPLCLITVDEKKLLDFLSLFYMMPYKILLSFNYFVYAFVLFIYRVFL